MGYRLVVVLACLALMAPGCSSSRVEDPTPTARSSETAAARTDSARAAEKLRTAKAKLPLELAQGSKLGKDTAPLKLTVFGDFQCPFCLVYSSEQEPVIVEEYVKSGKVQLLYEHFPGLGYESVRAAVAAQCAADQNRFWQYHNHLFLIQAEAGQLDDEKLNIKRFGDDALKQVASDEGLDRAAFDTCLDQDTHIQLVMDQQRRSRGLGISGTPGFLVNGTPIGSGAPATLDEWRRVLDNAIARVR